MFAGCLFENFITLDNSAFATGLYLYQTGNLAFVGAYHGTAPRKAYAEAAQQQLKFFIF